MVGHSELIRFKIRIDLNRTEQRVKLIPNFSLHIKCLERLFPGIQCGFAVKNHLYSPDLRIQATLFWL